MFVHLLVASVGFCGFHDFGGYEVVVEAAPVVRLQAAPVYQYPFAYSVGQSIFRQQQEADYAEFEEFLEWKRSRKAEAPQAAAAGPVMRTCGKCHAEGEQGIKLDGSPLSAEQITSSIRELASGRMPPDNQLSREDRNTVLQALLGLEASAEPPPIPTEELP